MRLPCLLLLSACLLLARSAFAAVSADFAVNPGCRTAIAAVERAGGLPPGLLGAIAHVESGRRDPVSGQTEPWPWTADVEGAGYFYNSKAEAVAAVRRFQAQGIRSIDVGCMQVNLQQHPNAFASLEAAFDPGANTAYAARFLHELYDQTGNWSKAAAMYHSATPAIGADYERKVLAVLPEEQRLAGSPGASPMARAWAASLGTPPGMSPGTSPGIFQGMTQGVAPASPFGGGGGVGAGRRPMNGMAMGMGKGMVGRTLATYRAMPVRMALIARVPIFARR